MIPGSKLPEFIFVYGSLRSEVEHVVFAKVKAHLHYVGIGYFSGVLLDLGKYPGAVVTDDGMMTVVGEVYSIEEYRNEVFRVLDKYEGYNRHDHRKSLFIRKRTIIHLKNGKKISAWIYLYNRQKEIQKAKPIRSGDYIRFQKQKSNGAKNQSHL